MPTGGFAHREFTNAKETTSPTAATTITKRKIDYSSNWRHKLPIELRQISYFITSAEQGSFRKAAASLGIQESSISRRIRDLEDELGASLFQRDNGGVRLTWAGERFLRRAREALRQIDYGAKDVAAVGRSEVGHVKIGIFSSLASGFLFNLLRAYDKGHSSVLVELIEGDPSEHIAAIRQLRLDVAFVTGTSEWIGCETEHLWTERVFAVMHDDHPLARKEQIDWHDLAGSIFIVSDAAPGPEIHDYLVQRLADLGRHPEVQQQYVGRDNLLSLVAVSRRLTLTSEATTAACFPGVIFRPIRDEVLPFSAVWSPQNDNPACRRLLSLARSMATSCKAAGISF